MRKFLIHSTFWTLYIAYEVCGIFLMRAKGYSSVPDLGIHYAINIILFYCTIYAFRYAFSLPSNRLLFAILLVIAEFPLYIIIEYLVYDFFADKKLLPSEYVAFGLLAANIYRAIYFVGIAIAYWISLSVAAQKKLIFEMETDSLKKAKETAELENKLTQAKNAYLQSQLNPHLLFNTLNFIYNSVRKLSDSAASAILLLSDMMRYSLADTGANGKVALENEVEHIRNFFTLNQLRFNEKLNIKLDIKGIFDRDQIIPLLLISFIENMYKHGELNDPNIPASIEISCLDHQLEMHCFNKKARLSFKQGWGIGVDNAKSRLDTYYPNQYELNVTNGENDYQIDLKINL